MPMTPPLAVEHLTVALDGATILRDVSLAVAPGETVALMGANGSGKSTLVRTITGLLRPTSGTVRLLGADVTGHDVPWQRLGYVPQRVGPASGVPATALEVVASGTLHGRRLRPGRAGYRAAREALDAVGLAHRAQDPVNVFSGGQQRRVLIARALVRRPSLLVLDEPMAGVDRTSRDALVGVLRTLQAEGTTMLVVLHETAELGGLLHRGVVLRRGRVVHDGALPKAAPGHDAPDHDHVHPHAADDDLEPPLYEIDVAPLPQDRR